MTQPWYRRFPDNFLGGINGMTLEEKGAYGVVIDMIYQRGGPIADEPRYIAGICNCSVRKWNAIRARLIELGKLVVIDGHLMNERAGIELENAAKTARKHAENGAKGGEKSAEKRAASSKNNDLAQARLKHTRASLHQNSIKEGNASRDDPTDGLVLYRTRAADEALWLACEEVMGEKVRPFLSKFRFPAATVEEARSRLAPAPQPETTH